MVKSSKICTQTAKDKASSHKHWYVEESTVVGSARVEFVEDRCNSMVSVHENSQ